MNRVRFAAIAFVILTATRAFAAPRIDAMLGVYDIAFDPTYYSASTALPPAPPAPQNALIPLRTAARATQSAAASKPPTFRFPELEKDKLAKFDADRQASIQAAIDKMPGMVGRFSFRIVDVRARPEARTWISAANPTWRQRHATLAEAFRVEAASMKDKPIVAIGEITLNESERLQELRAEQARIATENVAEAREARARAAKATTATDKKLLQTAAAYEQKKRDDRIAALRKQIDAITGSDDYVYLYGTPEEFAAWRPGQTRSVVGVVSRVRVSLTQQNDTSALQFDAIVTPLAKAEVVAGDDAAAAAP